MPDQGAAAPVYAFGEFELEPQLRQLRRRGQPVELASRPLELLNYLIEHRDRAVSKDELLGALWRGLSVVEGNLYTQMNLVRRALRQRPKDRAPIRTEHGRGYRFVAPVQVLRCPPSTLSAREFDSGATPLIGRGDVLDALRSALGAAESHRGQLWMLTGEAGIGKTRVATEFAQLAAASGTSVWVGRCRADEDAPAYWPFIELLRSAMGELANAPLRALCRATPPELSALLPELEDYADPAAATASNNASRLGFFAAVLTLLGRAAKLRPRVLILEDLHWSDASSAKLLLHVATDIASHRLLVIGTRRDAAQRDRSARQAISSLLALPHCREQQLSGLKRADVIACIASLTQAAPSARLTDVVHRKTAGNPLLIQAMVRTLTRERGAQAVVNWQGDDLQWSDMVRDPVRERIGQLPPGARLLLELAAAIGTQFDLPLLSAAGATPMAAVLEALAPARAQGLLRQNAETPWRFEFAHELTRDTVYGDVEPTRRVALHLAVAEALAARGTPSAAEVRALAYHYRNAIGAGVQERAAEYAELAAIGAARATAFEDAATLYGWALEALDVAPEGSLPKRLQLLQGLGRAHRDAGRPREARAVFEQAIELARKHGQREQFASSALGLRLCVPFLSRPEPAVERRLEEALDILGDAKPSLRAALLAWLARNRALTGDQKRQMLAEARATPNLEPYTRFAIAESTLMLDAGPDSLHAHLSACDEMQALGAANRAAFWSWRAHLSRGRALLTLCDVAACDREISACQGLQAELGWSYMVFWTEIMKIQRAIGDGRFEDAQAANAVLTRASSGTAPHINFDYLLRLQRLELGRARGELAAIADHVDRFVEDFSFIGNPLFWRALLYTAQGDQARLRESLDRIGLWMSGDHRRGENFLYYACSIAEMCVAVDDRRLGERTYHALLPYQKLNACNGVVYLGSVSHYLGMLAMLLGRPEAAAAHYEVALVVNRQLGALPAFRRTHLACSAAAAAAPDPAARQRFAGVLEALPPMRC